jgi:acetoin utilization deacetylase AcuC-like enzyme
LNYLKARIIIHFIAFSTKKLLLRRAQVASTMLVHSKKYTTDLASFGIDKPFALDRGELVLSRLKDEFGVTNIQTQEPDPITREDALLVHTPSYVDSLQRPEVWRDIFELKPNEYKPEQATRPLNELFDDIALKSGGTKLAVSLACKTGKPTANLGGGYHHAFPDQGRGFCVLHDIGIAIRSAQRAGLLQRCLIVDVDFHQGDGSAVIFKNDPSVFTLSIHSEEGWPEVKQESDLDIPVFQGEEHLYVEKLADGLDLALSRFSPDFVMFVAGSDPYEKDVLPGTAFLKLSLHELQRRDELVIDRFATQGIPLSMVFAGGYGPDVWEVHFLATRRIVEHSIMSDSSSIS